VAIISRPKYHVLVEKTLPMCDKNTVNGCQGNRLLYFYKILVSKEFLEETE
jgi:hypothetical protein